MLKTVDGASYLKDYNFKMLPGTGPYVVNEADVVKGKSVSIRRRKDYWAEKHRRQRRQNNFDEIRETVVRDQNLAFEMFKKGDLDVLLREHLAAVGRGVELRPGPARPDPEAQDLQRHPSGKSGLAFNTRKAPFDDIRVRKALAHLLNRQLMIEKLFFKEYVPLNSYFAGGIYENPNNPKMPVRPAARAQAARRGGLEGPRRAGTPGEERPAAHDRAAVRDDKGSEERG